MEVYPENDEIDNFVVDALEIKESATTTDSEFSSERRSYVYTDGTDIPLEKSSKLLRKLLDASPFGTSDIEEYDRFLDLAKECIPSRWLPLPPVIEQGRGQIQRVRFATFSNLRIEPPSYTVDGVTYSETPQMCRLQGETYGSQWKVTVTIRYDSPQGDIARDPFEIEIGKVPIMLGSRHCVLRGKSAEDLLLLGEDPDDMFGYFVVSGAEKVVLKQEKLVVNRALLMAPSKALPTIRITVKTIRGTIVVEMLQQEKNIIEMKFPSLKQKTGDKNKDKAMSFNVVRVLRIIGRFHAQLMGIPLEKAKYQTVKQIEDLVKLFVDPACQRAALNKLGNTFVASFTDANDEQQMMAQVEKGDLDQQEMIREIGLIFNNDLFTHLTEIPTRGYEGDARHGRLYEYKAYLFGFMLGRYLEHLAGFRPLDNRDAWSNKREVGAGCMMEQLFRTNWYKILTEASFKDRILSQGGYEPENRLQVTENFRTSFTTPNWGVRGRQMKNNVAQTMGRTSVLETYSHLSTVDVSVSRNNVANSIRQIQQTQWNVICPISTPEGDNCGVVKTNSLTVRLSLERRDTELINVLLGYEPIDSSPAREYVTLMPGETQVMINGKFLGWTNDDLQTMLILWRRKKHLAYDVSIIQIGNILYVDMSPSRPIFPYLVVDPSSQKLVIDILKLRDAPIEVMLAKGAIEYISAWEQEYVKVAPFESDIGDRLALLRKCKADVALYEKEVARIKSMKEKSVDVPVKAPKDDAIALVKAKIAVKKTKENEKELRDIMNSSHTTFTVVTSRTKQELLEDAENQLQTSIEELQSAEKQQPYDYCHVDPITFVSVLGAAIPYPDHNQAPRNTFQAAMSKQPIGTSHVNYLERITDGKSKSLISPTRPIVETEIASSIGLNNRCSGKNATIAFMCGKNGEEDAFIVKKEMIDNGGFRSMKYLVYKQDFESVGSVNQILTKPTIKNDEPTTRYDNIGPNGLPYIGAMLREGDCIIGKVHTRTIDVGKTSFLPGSNKKSERVTEETNESVCLKVGDEGVVEKVFIYQTAAKIKVVIKLRIMHTPDLGDKFSPRNAQKGTLGKILRANEMPYSKSGIIPDFLINPSGIPSRMTLSYFFEMLDCKTGALLGKRRNGTAFRQETKFNLAECRRILKSYSDSPNYEYGEEVLYSGITGERLADTIFVAPVFMQALKHQAMSKNQCRGEGPVKPMTRQPPKNKSNRGGIRFGEMERDAACAFGASSFVMERLCIVSDAYTPVFCAKCGYYADNVPGGGYYCPLCQNATEFGNCQIAYCTKLLEHLLGAAGIRLRINFTTFDKVKDKIYSADYGFAMTGEEIYELATQDLDDAENNDAEDIRDLNMEADEGDYDN